MQIMGCSDGTGLWDGFRMDGSHSLGRDIV